MKNFLSRLALVAGLATSMFASTGAEAVTTQLTATIAFQTPITLTKNADINFGIVTANSASTYKISTAGVVTTTAGTGVWLGGTKTVGNINIVGSSSSTISISATNYQANNGVTPSAATCAYNGGAEAACSLSSQTAPNTGKTLLVGVSVAASGSQGMGLTANPTFDIVVSYG